MNKSRVALVFTFIVYGVVSQFYFHKMVDLNRTLLAEIKSLTPLIAKEQDEILTLQDTVRMQDDTLTRQDAVIKRQQAVIKKESAYILKTRTFFSAPCSGLVVKGRLILTHCPGLTTTGDSAVVGYQLPPAVSASPKVQGPHSPVKGIIGLAPHTSQR